MKQFKGFDEAKEKAKYTGSAQLPVGGYVAKIIDVKYEDGKDGNSDKITVAFDIDEGDYKGFFKKQFEENTQEDKKWKGKAVIYVPSDDGSEKDEWTKNSFARWTNAFEDSNAKYHWDWDEKKWKGLYIGVIYGEVGTVIDGKHIKYNECRFPASIDTIRKGEYKIPTLKKKNGFSEASINASSGTPDFMNIPDVAAEEIPF